MSRIFNESAYNNAIVNRIRWNASLTRRRKWESETPDHERLFNCLHSVGEFETRLCKQCKKPWEQHLVLIDTNGYVEEPTKYCSQVDNPLAKTLWYGKGGDILLSIRDQFDQWGNLSPKQTELVRTMIARAEQRVADRIASGEQRLEFDRQNSKHIGTVGDRIVLRLNVERVLSFEGDFGMSYINLCRDESGSLVVYKGSKAFEVGPIVVKATIKAHAERDGVAQTLISRPTEVAA